MDKFPSGETGRLLMWRDNQDLLLSAKVLAATLVSVFGGYAGHDLLLSLAALLHCTGTISEHEMRRIAAKSPVKMPYSIEWVDWHHSSKGSPRSSDVLFGTDVWNHP